MIPGQTLVILGLCSALVRAKRYILLNANMVHQASCIIFALIKVHASYWAMAFIVMITLPMIDIAYTVANLQVCCSFPSHSQALAGSIFSVATRVSYQPAFYSGICTDIVLAWDLYRSRRNLHRRQFGLDQIQQKPPQIELVRSRGAYGRLPSGRLGLLRYDWREPRHCFCRNAWRWFSWSKGYR